MQGRAVPQARGSASRNPCSTTEIDTDTDYDSFGRLWHTYQPTYTGATQQLDNVKTYDELNRVTLVQIACFLCLLFVLIASFK